MNNFKLPYTGSEIAAILEKAANGQVLSLDEKAAVQALTVELATGGNLMTPEQVEKLDSLVGFEGTLATTQPQPNVYSITRPSSATASGVYKTSGSVKGVAIVQMSGSSYATITLVFNGKLYKGSGSGDTITLNAVEVGTKLYRHRIEMSDYGYLAEVELDSSGTFVPGTFTKGTYASKTLAFVNEKESACTSWMQVNLNGAFSAVVNHQTDSYDHLLGSGYSASNFMVVVRGVKLYAFYVDTNTTITDTVTPL